MHCVCSVVFVVLILLNLSQFFLFCHGRHLKRKEFFTLHEWTNLALSFYTNENLTNVIDYGILNNRPVPVDVDVEYGDDGHYRTFLTIPRLSSQLAPYSLATVAAADNHIVLNPRLVPYPSFEWHIRGGANCTGIVSAIKTFIDECWRLWVVDSGQVNSVQLCAPKILAFDLVSDALVHVHVLSEKNFKPGVSVFTAMAVDVGEDEPREQCLDTMVYIADAWGYGLIVYDAKARIAWRIEHAFMQPDTKLRMQNSASDGIFTVTLSPKAVGESRQVYFHALNSYTEIAVPLRIVNNASLWLNVTAIKTASLDSFQVLGNRSTQCESEAVDSAGNLYCTLISVGAIIAWSPETNYTADQLKVVAYNPKQFKFITGLKVNKNAESQDELWALSSEPSLFMGDNHLESSIQFRIVGCRVNDLLENEDCTVGVATIRKWNSKDFNNN